MSDSDHKRRQFLRARLQGTLTVHDREGDFSFQAADISQGGAFIASPILLEEGDLVRVSFQLPDADHPISVQARVARGCKASGDPDQSGMGLEFIDLPVEDQRAIAAYVVRTLNAAF